LAGADDYSKAMPVILSFDYAYAAYPFGSTIFSETMFITVRGDCMGVEESFILYEEDLANLATRTPTTAFFIPTASQWGTFTIDLTQVVEQMKAFGFAEKTVFFGVSNLGNLGNNFYIDNIRYDDLVADFSFSENHLCGIGNTVRFDDTSVLGNPVSRKWTFEGGSPATSTSKGLSVKYNTVGKFGVGIEVADADGVTNSIFVEDLITVIDNTTKYPYTSTSTLSFETSTQRNVTPEATFNGWKVFDELGEANDIRFPPFTIGGVTSYYSAFGVGLYSVRFDNFNNLPGAGTTDGYISLPIDITKEKELTLIFDYAYRIYPGSADGLIIAYAIDCGDDTNLFGFTNLWEKYGNELATVSGSTTSAFYPTSTQWKTERIDLSAIIRANPNGKSIKVAILNYNDYGNNVWIDNIQLGKCTNAAPTSVASNVVYSDTKMGRTDLSWTRGNGTHVMVIAKKGAFSSSFAIPTGTTATMGTWHFGKNEIMPGHYLIHNGTGTFLNDVKGLMPNESYSFAVVEYNYSKICGDGGNRFAKATTKSVTTPTTNASAAWISGNTLTSANVYWTAGAGDGRIAVMRENAKVSGTMDRMLTHGTDYTGHTTLGMGHNLGDAHFVMHNGAGTSINANKLMAGKEYGFAVIEYYLDADNRKVYHAKDYKRASFIPQGRMASNTRMTSAGNTSMNISWTNGNGTKRMLVMKEGNNFPRTINTSNGMTYTANTNFGSGHHFGDGIYAVYSGTGSSTSVTGLKRNTRYSFAVVEFDDLSGTYYFKDYARVEARTANSGVREGVEEESQEISLSFEESFEVYPNPSRGEVNFVMFAGNQKPVHLAIYNTIGALVYEVTANDELNTKLDVSKFGKGMFVAKVTVDGNSATKKFVIE
jgi:hypothetical protein